MAAENAPEARQAQRLGAHRAPVRGLAILPVGNEPEDRQAHGVHLPGKLEMDPATRGHLSTLPPPKRGGVAGKVG